MHRAHKDEFIIIPLCPLWFKRLCFKGTLVFLEPMYSYVNITTAKKQELSIKTRIYIPVSKIKPTLC
jgi:hypothetical protein